MGVSPRPAFPQEFPAVVRTKDNVGILAIRRWHRDTVRRAIQTEFDLVYVYAGHGIPIFAQILPPRINQHSGEYGGSIENRALLLRETLEEVIDEANNRRAVAIRFCVDEQEGLPLSQRRMTAQWWRCWPRSPPCGMSMSAANSVSRSDST